MLMAIKNDYNIYQMRKDRPFNIYYQYLSCVATIKDLGIKNICYPNNNCFEYENLKIFVKGVLYKL